MKIFKNKNFWQIVIIVIVILVSAVLLFFPEAIKHKYKYSYESMGNKKEEVNMLNNTLTSNENIIEDSIENLEMMKEESKWKEEEAVNIRRGIKDSDFELHMPSILISLEQTAIENNVALSIRYDSIITSTPTDTDDVENMDYDDYQDDFDNPDEQSGDIDNDENNDVRIKDNPKSEENEENEQPNEDVEAINANLGGMVPNIEGINVTTIPIDITGSYYNVRNYIKYLDKIGMIEPSSVTLESRLVNENEDENTMKSELSGSVMLNVFHGEVE